MFEDATDELFDQLFSASAKPAEIKRLLKQRANVNATRSSGEGFDYGDVKPLHLAALAYGPGMVKLLVEARAKLECKTSEGQTPLHLALRSGHAAVASSLIALRADIQARDKSGRTPVHVACVKDDGATWSSPSKSDCDAVAVLLRAKASINVKDKRGMTPLKYASENEHRFLVEFLQKAENLEQRKKAKRSKATKSMKAMPMKTTKATKVMKAVEATRGTGSSIKAIKTLKKKNGAGMKSSQVFRSGRTGALRSLV